MPHGLSTEGRPFEVLIGSRELSLNFGDGRAGQAAAVMG